VPLVAVAALVAVAGAILAIPYLLVRSVRGSRDRSTAADTAPPRAVVASRSLG
jgi:hypothetical protein